MSLVKCPACGSLVSTEFPIHTCRRRKPLLDIKSPKYLRRLVREINKQRRNGARIYACDSITGEKFRVYACKFNGVSISNGNGTRYLNPESVENDLGRAVCASREP